MGGKQDVPRQPVSEFSYNTADHGLFASSAEARASAMLVRDIVASTTFIVTGRVALWRVSTRSVVGAAWGCGVCRDDNGVALRALSGDAAGGDPAGGAGGSDMGDGCV